MPALVVDWCPDDNAPDVFNPDQTDTDLDGIGDPTLSMTRKKPRKHLTSIKKSINWPKHSQSINVKD